MAKVTFIEPIATFRGKICKHSEVIFKHQSESGTNFTSRICHPRDYKTNPLSASEQAAQEKFKQAATTAHSEMKDADKKEAAKLIKEILEAAILRWETAGKHGSLYSFLFKEAYAKL